MGEQNNTKCRARMRASNLGRCRTLPERRLGLAAGRAPGAGKLAQRGGRGQCPQRGAEAPGSESRGAHSLVDDRASHLRTCARAVVPGRVLQQQHRLAAQADLQMEGDAPAGAATDQDPRGLPARS